MPKTFATAFGLKEFDDLETIKNDLSQLQELVKQQNKKELMYKC